MSEKVFDRGERLKQLRLSKGLKQSQVAQRFNVRTATVSLWEAGTGSLSEQRIKQLAREYGTTADYILGLDSREAVFFDDRLTEEEREAIKKVIHIMTAQIIKNKDQ